MKRPVGFTDFIQAVVPDPALSPTNASLTGSVVFGVGVGDVDIAGHEAISVFPVDDSYYYYNSDTTKKWPLKGGQPDTIFVLQLAAGESVTVVFGTALTENAVQIEI